MAKKVKMMLYGAPGVGKSVFASKFPKPFFITTDGNYEWLVDFGAKVEDHKQISSWGEFVNLIKDSKFSNYDTIVVDLIEDLYQWSEDFFIKKNKIDHIGDLPFGKGYKMVRDSFFIEISKLIALDKNIILLSHETHTEQKDKRGVVVSTYHPSKSLNSELRDKIEGRLRYVLRAKFTDEIVDNKYVQKRVLSLAKNSSEFSIIRGVNMDEIPETIELDFNSFAKLFKLEKELLEAKSQSPQIQPQKVEQPQVTPQPVQPQIVETPQPQTQQIDRLNLLNKLKQKREESITTAEFNNIVDSLDELKTPEVAQPQTPQIQPQTPQTPEVSAPKPSTNMEEIRARLAKLKAAQGIK